MAARTLGWAQLKVVGLLLLLLMGCHSHTGQSCLFGGATEVEGEYCARKNFGEVGAAYLREQAERCPKCNATTDADEAQWCVLNCRFQGRGF